MLEVEALVILACVEKSVVAVSTVVEAVLSTVLPDTVRAEDDALARVLCPVTESVPLEVSDEVAVIDPPVKEEKIPVTAVRRVEKRLDEVALVLVKLVIVPVVEKRLVAVSVVAEAVLSTV
jgi:hypothetical protein